MQIKRAKSEWGQKNRDLIPLDLYYEGTILSLVHYEREEKSENVGGERWKSSFW